MSPGNVISLGLAEFLIPTAPYYLLSCSSTARAWQWSLNVIKLCLFSRAAFSQVLIPLPSDFGSNLQPPIVPTSVLLSG